MHAVTRGLRAPSQSIIARLGESLRIPFVNEAVVDHAHAPARHHLDISKYCSLRPRSRYCLPGMPDQPHSQRRAAPSGAASLRHEYEDRT
jgi:hypothetical protein